MATSTPPDDVDEAIIDGKALFSTVDGRYVEVDMKAIECYDIHISHVMKHSTSVNQPGPHANFLANDVSTIRRNFTSTC